MSEFLDDQIFKRALLDLLSPPAVSCHNDPCHGAENKSRTRRRKQSSPELDQATTTVVTMQVLERISANTIAVRCSSPQVGCYAEQLWRISRARRSARCSLTGLLIQRGDVVFRPSSRRNLPFNVDRMILASAVLREDIASSRGIGK
jgi:hypothetical protein